MRTMKIVLRWHIVATCAPLQMDYGSMGLDLMALSKDSVFNVQGMAYWGRVCHIGVCQT